MAKNRLDQSFIYKNFKKKLVDNYGAGEAEILWRAIGQKYDELEKSYPDCDDDSKMMMVPAVAIYQVNPELLPLLKEYAQTVGEKLGKIVHGFTSIPFVSKLLWENMPKLMRSMSSADKGYERRIVSENKDLVGVDILVCPLHQTALKLGALEVSGVVCIMDKAYMTGFKYIDYTRTTAIGEGAEFCDYRLRFNKNKK